MMNSEKGLKGFTLPDLLVGIVIIGVIAVAGLEINSVAGKMQKNQQDRLQATYIAASQIEDLKKYADQYGIFRPQFADNTNPHNNTINLPNSDYSSPYTITDRRWDGNLPTTDSPFHYKEIDVAGRYRQQTVNLKGYVYKRK